MDTDIEYQLETWYAKYTAPVTQRWTDRVLAEQNLLSAPDQPGFRTAILYQIERTEIGRIERKS